MDDNDDDYIGLTEQHRERLREMATSASLSPRTGRRSGGRSPSWIVLKKERVARTSSSVRPWARSHSTGLLHLPANLSPGMSLSMHVHVPFAGLQLRLLFAA